MALISSGSPVASHQGRSARQRSLSQFGTVNEPSPQRFECIQVWLFLDCGQPIDRAGSSSAAVFAIGVGGLQVFAAGRPSCAAIVVTRPSNASASSMCRMMRVRHIAHCGANCFASRVHAATVGVCRSSSNADAASRTIAYIVSSAGEMRFSLRLLGTIDIH
jgi:hypothetical protein